MSRYAKAFIVVAATLLVVFAIYSLNSKATADVAVRQLKAISIDDFDGAYSYFSRDFKSSIAKEEFRRFVEAHPNLENQERSEIVNQRTDRDSGSINATITSANGKITPVELGLVREDRSWKVQSLRIKGDKVAAIGATITNLAVSDKIDRQSLVRDGGREFDPKSDQLFLNVQLKSANIESKCAVELVYPGNGEKAGPATSGVHEMNTVLSFSFARPSGGWPSGEYRMTVRLSTGESKELRFQVR